MLDFSYYSAVLELLKGAIYVEHGKTFPMFHLGKGSLEKKFTVQLVVGDEKSTVTMVLNNNLWLEINANTSSNERMPARHRSL